jgi:hypothetical protein
MDWLREIGMVVVAVIIWVVLQGVLRKAGVST